MRFEDDQKGELYKAKQYLQQQNHTSYLGVYVKPIHVDLDRISLAI